MKRIVLSAIAASMLVLPSVGAQAAPFNAPVAAPLAHSSVTPVAHREVVRKKVVVRKHGEVVRKSVRERDHHWKRGQRLDNWQRRTAVRDYGRHGLRRPPHGQQWVKVGNDYLLISIASGVIGALIAGH